MKKDKILLICEICLIIIAIAFIVVTICTRFENNIYLLLSIVCSLIVNILNLIRSSSIKEENKNKSR